MNSSALFLSCSFESVETSFGYLSPMIKAIIYIRYAETQYMWTFFAFDDEDSRFFVAIAIHLFFLSVSKIGNVIVMAHVCG